MSYSVPSAVLHDKLDKAGPVIFPFCVYATAILWTHLTRHARLVALTIILSGDDASDYEGALTLAKARTANAWNEADCGPHAEWKDLMSHCTGFAITRG